MAVTPSAETLADSPSHPPSTPPWMFAENDTLSELAGEAANAVSEVRHLFSAYVALEHIAQAASPDDDSLIVSTGGLHALLSTLNQAMQEQVQATHDCCHQLVEEMNRQMQAVRQASPQAPWGLPDD